MITLFDFARIVAERKKPMTKDIAQDLEDKLYDLLRLVTQEKHRVEELHHRLMDMDEGSRERLIMADEIAVLEDSVDRLNERIKETCAELEQIDRV